MRNGSHINLVGLSDEALHYLDRSAAIRQVSCTRLLQRLIKTICEDQLILSILDDEAKKSRQLPGEAGVSKTRKNNPEHPYG